MCKGNEGWITSNQPDRPTEDYLAQGFRNVDAAAVGKMTRCLAFMDSLPEFQRYKTSILDRMNLRRGSITADLGCGLGFDVRRLSALVGPEGRAIGVDSSRVLIESARSASQGFSALEFVQADIQSLPFASGFLHSCKVDRTLQHVGRPASVLNEMFRTLCSGGAVVCAEPDWETFVIDTSFVDDAQDSMARQIAKIWSESFRHPRIGRQLGGYLEEAGFVDIQVQDALLTTPSFASSEMVFDIVQTAVRLATNSGSDEPHDWLAKLREPDQRVCCSVTLVINVARRP